MRNSPLIDVLAQAAQYDFCPWAEPWVYWLKQPLTCLVFAGSAAIACGYFVNPQLLSAALAIAAIVFLGVFWPAIALRGLRCKLVFESARGREGCPVRVSIRIRNRFPWPAWGVSLQRGFSATTGPSLTPASHTRGVALAKVPGWTTSEFDWEFVPEARGEYPLQPPLLETAFPFGLWRGKRPVEVDGKLLVWPSTVELGAIPKSADECPPEDTLSEHRVGDSGDLMGTRLFREGDSLRRVHWAQTARHNRLIYCERQTAAQSAVEVVLDADVRAHRGSGPNSSLEWAIRITASICQSLSALSAHVECLIGRERIAVGRGRQGMRRLLDTLATLPATGLSDQLPLQGCRCRRGHHRSMQIVVTTDIGLRPASRGAPRGTEHRQVILHASGFEPGASEDSSAALVRPWIWIGNARDASERFAAEWKRACHAG